MKKLQSHPQEVDLFQFHSQKGTSSDVCLAGKRISQKLLRNCTKFLSIIHDVLKIAPMEFIRQSADEIEIRGPESKYDTRKLNSYPSKVGCPQLCCAYCPFSVFLRRLAFCVQFTAFKICFSLYS